MINSIMAALPAKLASLLERCCVVKPPYTPDSFTFVNELDAFLEPLACYSDERFHEG